jgi:2-dehydropantoate 2-reductase
MIERKYSILSFGAGAIGTYIGGSLALQGHSVVFIEQIQIADEIRRNGLHLMIDTKESVIASPQIADSLSEALSSNRFDFAIFALKSFDTSAALEQMAPHVREMPPLLCMQNGVENEIAIEQGLGKSKVIACSITSAVGRNGAGNITLEKKRGVGIADNHPLSHDLLDIFNQANLNGCLYRNASAMKWSKMITNLMANASSAILDMTPFDIYAHPKACFIEIEQLREALRVMAALNIPVVNLPGTPVKPLAFLVKNFPQPVCSMLLKQLVGKGRGGKMPSFHIDLYNKRPKIEVDYLNGAVVRFGEKAGIPTPVNRWLNQTLLDLCSGKTPLDTYRRQPARVLESINQLL